MQELDPLVFISVLWEMMGLLLPLLVLVAAGGIGAFVWVLMQEGELRSSRLLRAELIGVLGGFGALALMAWVTVSGFTDAGGPVDWLLIGVIWGMGLVGVTILAYAIMGMMTLYRPSMR